MAKKPIKKYQTQSTVEKARNVMAGIKKNTKSEPATRKDFLNVIDYYETQNARYGDIDYLNRAKNDKTSSELMKEVRYGLSPAKAAKLAVKKGEENAKFKRAPHPSDILGKPKYLQKKGGSITALDQVDKMEKAKLLKGKK